MNTVYPIGKFIYRGQLLDYSAAGYAIDGCHVYRNGKRLASNRIGVCLSFDGLSTKFSKIRLFLAVAHGVSADVEAVSGIRVINQDIPIHDANRYAWETPDDREALIQAKQDILDASDDVWATVEYNGRVFDKYEISKKTGIIRHKLTKRERAVTSQGQVGLRTDEDSRIKNMPLVHRAYMSTYVKDRRDDQTEVDHINGDHTDNRPCNLRWASPFENKLYKFGAPTPRVVGEKFTGDLSTLKRFENTNWYFGVVGDDYAVVYEGRVRRVGDFRVTQRSPYPMAASRPVHCVVAFVEGRMTKKQFYDRKSTEVVRHLNGIKTDFRPDNLVLGTPSENGNDTQDNPETSQRKRVRQIDERGVCVEEHVSITAAAKAVAGSRQGIEKAIRRKYRHMSFMWASV